MSFKTGSSKIVWAITILIALVVIIGASSLYLYGSVPINAKIFTNGANGNTSQNDELTQEINSMQNDLDNLNQNLTDFDNVDSSQDTPLSL